MEVCNIIGVIGSIHMLTVLGEFLGWLSEYCHNFVASVGAIQSRYLCKSGTEKGMVYYIHLSETQSDLFSSVLDSDPHPFTD